MDVTALMALLESLGRHTDPAIAAAFAIAAGVFALAGIALITPLGRIVLPEPRDSWMSDVNPFEATLQDHFTILCKDGTIVATIEIEGIDMATADWRRRNDMSEGRRRWVDGLAGKPVKVRALATRRRRPIETGGAGSTQGVHGAVAITMDAWHRPFSDSFETKHTLVLSVAGGTERAREILTEAVEMTLETLRPYRPRLLRLIDEKDARLDRGPGEASPLLSFWNEMWNPCAGARGLQMRRGIPNSAKRLSERMRADGLETQTSTGLLAFKDGANARFVYSIAVSEFGEASSDMLVGDLLSIDGEITVLHHFEAFDKATAELFVEHRGRMAVAGRAGMAAADAKAQFSAVTALLSPDAERSAVLAEYQMTVFAHGDTPEQARLTQQAVRKVFRDWRINPISDTHIAASQWFLQFPTYDQRSRPNHLLGHNVSEFVNFERVTTGYGACAWGDFPTIVFRTSTRAPYRFIFHEDGRRTGEPNGHTFVCGRTGSGKSTTISMMAAGALRYPGMRVYMFDRHRGLYTFTKAMGGDYVMLDAGVEQTESVVRHARLTPLQMKETPQNHQHLIELFKIMIGFERMSEKLDSKKREEAEATIANLVSSNFAVDSASRKLSQIVNAGTEPGSEVRLAFAKWTNTNMLGGYFEAPGVTEKERLDLSKSRLVTFDVTHIFDHSDPSVPAAIAFHIFHRIKMEMIEHKAPALIVIDEAPKVLADPGFRAQTEILLREIRKLNGVVVLMAQTPDAMDAIDPKFGALVRNQTANHIFYRDPGAAGEMSAYRAWGLGQRELDFIRQADTRTDGLTRAMLLKRPASQESVVLDVAYDHLGPLRHYFASGRTAWETAIDQERVVGADWRESYIAHMEQLAGVAGRDRSSI